MLWVESVCKSELCIKFTIQDLRDEQQKAHLLEFKTSEFRIIKWVENSVVIELNNIERFASVFGAQILNY